MSTSAHRYGFTLIELIVVIALLAVLAAVVAPNLLGKASDANRKSAAIQLEKIANTPEANSKPAGTPIWTQLP